MLNLISFILNKKLFYPKLFSFNKNRQQTKFKNNSKNNLYLSFKNLEYTYKHNKIIAKKKIEQIYKQVE